MLKVVPKLFEYEAVQVRRDAALPPMVIPFEGTPHENGGAGRLVVGRGLTVDVFYGNWIVTDPNGKHTKYTEAEFDKCFGTLEEQGRDGDFVRGFKLLQSSVHQTAKTKGFWPPEGRNMGEQIALMHSELSEALEGHREGNNPDKHCPEFSSVEIEFADCIIRMMDTSHAYGFRVAEAIIAKAKFNNSRPYKHGKKF